MLVVAGVGLALVVGLGTVAIITRSSDRGRSGVTGSTAEADQPGRTGPAPPATIDDRQGRGGSSAPQPAGATVAARAAGSTASDTADAGPDAEVPVWARRPKITTQPFPEGARFDPPLPPIRIPPEMLPPPAEAPPGGRSP